MNDRIESMRTYFHGGGHDVDAARFARAILARRQNDVLRLRADLGFSSMQVDSVLDVAIGDPGRPASDPVSAYVNAGEWKARCECGGVEYVDLTDRIFMCCSCWNAAHANAWRPVIVPDERAQIERVLLQRPKMATRGWRPGEALVQLLMENVANGIAVDEQDLPLIIDVIDPVPAPEPAEVVP